MELPKYPAGPSVDMPGDSRTRQVATGLLGAQALMFLVSLPALVLLLFGAAWEGGDEQLKQRIISWVPTAGLGALAAALLLVFATFSVARDARDAPPLVAIGGVLAVGLSVGWVWVWRSALLTDPVWLIVWVLMTLPAPAAWLLLRRVRRAAG
jgi:hypothetical protein